MRRDTYRKSNTQKYIFAILITILLSLTGCNESTIASENAHLSDESQKANEEISANGIILSFSHESGVYEKEFTLTANYDKNYKLYYTTDGSDPSTSQTALLYSNGIDVNDRSKDANVVSAVSTSLITTNYCYLDGTDVICRVKEPSNQAVDKCTVLRFALKDSEGNVYATSNATYFIGTTNEHIRGIDKSCQASGTDLAVISISMDYEDLFSSNRGIYVRGNAFEHAYTYFRSINPNFSADDTRKITANYSMKGKTWERKAHIDFFEMNADGSKQMLSQDCGIRIQGNYSRSDLQKGFRLYARGEYGDKKFNYAVFGEELKDIKGKVIDSFDTLVLRAGGNCAFLAKYNDTYWQDLASEMNIATKRSRPCIVYLNGEYWGLYVLEEDYSDDYFQSHYDIDKEDIIVYKGDAEALSLGYKLDEGTLPEGETDESYYFRELLEFFETHSDLKSNKDYQDFSKLVDINSVMDYFAVEVWINNKWDWPGKNWSMWKAISSLPESPYADGRWRFCLYDVEFGGVSGAGDAKTNTIKEDNYKPKGLLDMNTNNPAVLCFAYLMTNEDFRDAYCNRLLSLSDTYFEKNVALELLCKYEGTYGPLFHQFFQRYPDTGDANNALYGGYGSSKCIRDFLILRKDNIQRMIDWVDKCYSLESSQ